MFHLSYTPDIGVNTRSQGKSGKDAALEREESEEAQATAKTGGVSTVFVMSIFTIITLYLSTQNVQTQVATQRRMARNVVMESWTLQQKLL